MQFPDDVRYSKDHEWARPEGDLFVVGISDYAQDQLGDIVFVELPETGRELQQNEEFGSVESVKAVSELFAPLAGTVMEVNGALDDAPEKVNQEPYSDGWMMKIKPADKADFEALMDRDAYLAMLKG
ncbi:glycine cleavage system protein GcvH [Desulfatitalea sp. M08but]|uniref:Glycine cleavage system H protein n=1 Tax=Desulfatitalea alkaliphila TaxID=2929485 RepID=A0AA41R4B8_9BACT|nr:glycine cleavage system protein GcvH [Desulfatitalea alkaliphila]MCJ8501213.1 glycine cleavage system protein GcvH [Desulfatitalea alkaliphila]